MNSASVAALFSCTPRFPCPPAKPAAERPTEVGGRKKGLDPTRYGDWERNGICVDF
ncbi:MAG: DUF1674 domain-containing protein [Proteobacteria bacterium]|nr:DUF1674 domain-containing protein [Pseudomonadota bacterium]